MPHIGLYVKTRSHINSHISLGLQLRSLWTWNVPCLGLVLSCINSKAEPCMGAEVLLQNRCCLVSWNCNPAGTHIQKSSCLGRSGRTSFGRMGVLSRKCLMKQSCSCWDLRLRQIRKLAPRNLLRRQVNTSQLHPQPVFCNKPEHENADYTARSTAGNEQTWSVHTTALYQQLQHTCQPIVVQMLCKQQLVQAVAEWKACTPRSLHTWAL